MPAQSGIDQAVLHLGDCRQQGLIIQSFTGGPFIEPLALEDPHSAILVALHKYSTKCYKLSTPDLIALG